MDEMGTFRGFDWEAEDIAMLSEEDLKGRLAALSEREKAVGYRRRILHGRIDFLRAELVRRGSAALPPEDLARVLLGGFAEGEPL
jgi:hypothetical protein